MTTREKTSLAQGAQEPAILRETLVAARDALVAFGKQAGWLPHQQAYSATMTEAELKLARAVQDIDAILAAPLSTSSGPEPAILRELVESLFEELSLVDGVGPSFVQRKLNVGYSKAMKLMELRAAILSALASPSGHQEQEP